nr:MAG TPA: hypothetical protein [Caudoviricetes sp.]
MRTFSVGISPSYKYIIPNNLIPNSYIIPNNLIVIYN